MSLSSCLFCNIVDGLAKADIVWEDEFAIAFLDRSPMKRGHLVIVPRSHVAQLWDMKENDFLKLMSLVRYLARPLSEVFKADRAAMAVEGFGVPHTHVHLVPVSAGNELDPCKQSLASNEDLAFAAGCIRERFRNLAPLLRDQSS